MRSVGLALGLGLALASCAARPQTIPPASTARAQTYLTPDEIAALVARVPDKPEPGSSQAAADIEASARMRALEHTDRWLLATRHAELRPPLALAHFDCALGFRIDPNSAPRLSAVLNRLLADVNGAAEAAKARAFRARPVGDDPDRAACQILTPAARASASYPSGSAAVATAYGEAMAALVPDRAEAVRRIAREIGLSRLVCGMHYPSDVAAGQALGAAAFEAIAAKPTYQTDLAGARPEIEQARAARRTSPACAAERAALSRPLP